METPASVLQVAGVRLWTVTPDLGGGGFLLGHRRDFATYRLERPVNTAFDVRPVFRVKLASHDVAAFHQPGFERRSASRKWVKDGASRRAQKARQPAH
jgi:hypothetical protein